MKLATLSRGPRSDSTRRFKEAALQRGHKVKVLDTLRLSIDLQKGIPDLSEIVCTGRVRFRREIDSKNAVVRTGHQRSHFVSGQEGDSQSTRRPEVKDPVSDELDNQSKDGSDTD